MNIKHLVFAVALAMPTAVSAANFTQNIAITGDTTHFGQSHVGGAGAFTDTFNFTGFSGTVLANAALISFGTTGAQNIDFISAFLNGSALDISNTGFLSTAISTGDITANSVLTLVVDGTAGTNASYSGVLNIQAAPVPEPESYALMLAGLSLVGFAARRKK